MAHAVVDQLELVDVEEEDGDRALAPLRLTQCVLEPIEEQCAIGESGEGGVQRRVPGGLLRIVALDRVREDVRDRLHEVDVLRTEVVRLNRMRREDAKRLPLAL